MFRCFVNVFFVNFFLQLRTDTYIENEKNTRRRTKINKSNSSLEEIIFGVPQGYILGALLFNIFACHLFFIVNDNNFVSYADDINDVLDSLENVSLKLFDCFSNN